jgi:surfactin synthase thioesterase subunit
MTDYERWFISRGGTPAHVPRIYCFPHAGGNPRTFADWQRTDGTGTGAGTGVDADAEVEFAGVCRPGRDHRAQEPAPTIVEFIEGAADAIRAAADADGRAVYLFGHSLGALIAFEVARRLDGLPQLRHLIASGCSAPSLLPSKRVLAAAELEGRAFAEAVGFFGGLPAEVVADDALLDLLLPNVLADFRMAVGYHYQPGAPLTVPTTLIVGRDDPHVGAAQIEPWQQELRDSPNSHRVPGGHFYFEKQPTVATDILRAIVQDDQHVELI